MGQACSSACDCCGAGKPKSKRDIKISCFGIDGSGKTTILKILKGEDPRGVLSTNGFSVMEMDYDPQFHIKFYDVHGIMFIVGIGDREDESIQSLQTMMKHQQSARKPILIVLNNKINSEIDDVEFSNRANLQEIADNQQQMVFITHINTYDGSLNNIKMSAPLLIRIKKNRTALLEQFCCFIDKIIEHYVYLSEGVRAAELALKLKQNEDREARKLKMMQDQHNQRAAEVAQLEGRTSLAGVNSVFSHFDHDESILRDETPEIREAVVIPETVNVNTSIPEDPTPGSSQNPANPEISKFEDIPNLAAEASPIPAESIENLTSESKYDATTDIDINAASRAAFENPAFDDGEDIVVTEKAETERNQSRLSTRTRGNTNKVTPINEASIHREGEPEHNLDLFTVPSDGGTVELDPRLKKEKRLRCISRMDRIAKNKTMKLNGEITPGQFTSTRNSELVSMKSLNLSTI